MPKKQKLPILKKYDGDHLDQIALPLGGIGTGTISLGGRGDLRQWEIMGTPAKDFSPHGAFFTLRTKTAGSPAVARILEGPVPAHLHEGWFGSPATNHGLPRMRECEFQTAYPFGQVLFSDPEMPVQVRLEAFNPLVPGDSDGSGYPVAVLRYVVENRSSRSVEMALAGTLPNVIGGTSMTEKPRGSRNRLVEAGDKTPYPTILFDSSEVKKDEAEYGQMALSLLQKQGVSWKTTWMQGGWYPNMLLFFEELMEKGKLSDQKKVHPELKKHLSMTSPLLGSLCASGRIGPGQSKEVTFVIAWRFPNRRGWSVPPEKGGCKEGKCEKKKPAFVGNYYSKKFPNALAVLRDFVPRLSGLEKQTCSFVEAFCASDLPEAVKEAALFNVSTLRSETCFRTPEGYLFGFEGCCDRIGCCQGSCTHVWNYENTTPFLFGDLARSMREVEFLHATDDDGFMLFRVPLPFGTETDFRYAAADGQMGCLMKLYREYKLSGDADWLGKLWPRARKALEFCWIPGGWDADQDGFMEGCQHNTMDVEYYGPNPQMQGWYLGALRAAEEMARVLGEADFADHCRELFEAGSKKMDSLLFNGEYYEHVIQPPGKKKVDPRLAIHPYRTDSAGMPVNQLGKGCLVDQLVGHYMARVCGLGSLSKPANVRKTLKAIWKYNRRDHFWNHVNVLRTFAMQDESALLMAAYKEGERPETPFPYFTEVMTGFEYTAAVGMLYEGLEKQGLQAIKNVRDRFDGKKRNPYNEFECGHHYARAMAAWTAVLAWTGFQYSAPDKSISFADRPGNHFWSTGYAWGTARISESQGKRKVVIQPLYGELLLKKVALTGRGEQDLGKPRVVKARKPLRLELT